MFPMRKPRESKPTLGLLDDIIEEATREDRGDYCSGAVPFVSRLVTSGGVFMSRHMDGTCDGVPAPMTRLISTRPAPMWHMRRVHLGCVH